MLKTDYDYFNFDNLDDRLSLQEKSWDRSKELIIFDELHKLKNWKSWLKGVYDTEGIAPPILVTGSAKLDAYRKVGDSLAGRFFQIRKHGCLCPTKRNSFSGRLFWRNKETLLSKK